ncbi:MAG: mannose-6-phosphate isomerase, class I, partial [Deltaproteobacteria bacterium]|nr:mannose-6-phosphate isomerase, class I [Deltaproteobacteria bacterium]
MPNTIEPVKHAQPLRIFPQVKNYAWGVVGERSLVCRLARAQRPEVVAIDGLDGTPFAELWYGTHPSGAALYYSESEEHSLRDLIAESPREILGESLATQGFRELPFLFKILSVGAPLSIQAHPDKVLAEQLHARDPVHYPDSNHKPEMAIALTELELLYGFRPRAELEQLFDRLPPYQRLIGERWSRVKAASDAEFYEHVTRSLLEGRAEDLAAAGAQLVDEIRARSNRSAAESWILRTAELYPSDPGLFFFFVLNYYSLSPG